MRSVTSISIRAPASRVYAFAHATERWPEFLPHYRFVRVLHDDGDHRVLEMAARRGLIPVRWTAAQYNDPDNYGVRFVHLRGWTRGMEVSWILQGRSDVTTVSIVHDVVFRFPVAERTLERYVVTRYFIEGIASRTLACIKSLAEGSHDA
jgi:aromatase